MKCDFKSCLYPMVATTGDINRVIPVCRYHLAFLREEAGEFDVTIRAIIAAFTSHRRFIVRVRGAFAAYWSDGLHGGTNPAREKWHWRNRATGKARIQKEMAKAATARKREQEDYRPQWTPQLELMASLPIGGCTCQMVPDGIESAKYGQRLRAVCGTSKLTRQMKFSIIVKGSSIQITKTGLWNSAIPMLDQQEPISIGIAPKELLPAKVPFIPRLPMLTRTEKIALNTQCSPQMHGMGKNKGHRKIKRSRTKQRKAVLMNKVGHKHGSRQSRKRWTRETLEMHDPNLLAGRGQSGD